MKKFKIIVLVLALYALSYGIFRFSSIEIWEKDGKEYVIFPKDQVWMYYLYRPFTYLDGWLTGMKFHIGPHR